MNSSSISNLKWIIVDVKEIKMKFLILVFAVVAVANSHPSFGNPNIVSPNLPIVLKPIIVSPDVPVITGPLPVAPDLPIVAKPIIIAPEVPSTLPGQPIVVSPELPIVIKPIIVAPEVPSILPGLPIIPSPLPITPEMPSILAPVAPIQVLPGDNTQVGTFPAPIQDNSAVNVIGQSSPLVQVILNIVSDRAPASVVETIQAPSGITKLIAEAPMDITRPILELPVKTPALTRPAIMLPVISRPATDLIR